MSLKNRFLKTKAIEFKEEPIHLDEQQYEAVHTKEKRVLVVAGAGSGKTRVLTERVKHLLAKGVAPSSIVAITFTNMASEEMKSRLATVDSIGECFIGTIHSFANKIMSICSDTKYTILNTEISNGFFKELIQKYCKFITFDKYLAYMDVKNSYDLGLIPEHIYHGFLNPSEFAELMLIQGLNAPNIKNINNEDYPETIQDLCEKYNVIDFNQLLEMATEYFKKNNSDIEHLLIDEFQDIGTLEYNFFNSLKAKHVFYVGDDWQSIYGFKGGNVNIMLSLVNDPQYKVINIDRNYRNSVEISSLAVSIMNQVPNKIMKNVILDEETPEGEVFTSSKAMLKGVLESVVKDDKENLKDWFILVRTNKDLLAVQDVIDQVKLRYTTFRREGLSLADLKNLMDYNSIKLLTVHTAKGLEAKNVILYGSSFSINIPKYRNSPEERKVMYVGITRAEENLIILN